MNLFKKFTNTELLAILDIGVTEGTAPEQQRIIAGANIFYLLSIWAGLILVCEFFIIGGDSLLIAAALLVAGGLACFAHSYLYRYSPWPTAIFILGASAVFVYRAILTASPAPFYFWICLFPFLYFLTMGFKAGFLAIAVHTVAAGLIIFWPGSAFMTQAFSSMEHTQVVLVYVGGFTVAVAGELIRWLSYRKIGILMAQLHERTQTDELTGLYNRRAFHLTLESEARRSARSGKNFCLIMGDIDYFKKVNDTYGHLCGDMVLRNVSQLLKRRCRRTDTVTRWGGEEFIILMPETQLLNASRVAGELRIALASTPCYHGSAKIFVTMSFGVHECKPGGNLDEYLSKVDKLLYRAKNKGRNRIYSDLDHEQQEQSQI